MEKKQLLLITKNDDLSANTENEACPYYEITRVKSIHAGYPLALSYLPDVILIDHSSLGEECLRNLKNFKSTHFLNKSFLFLYGRREEKPVLDKKYKDQVDGILYDNRSYHSIIKEIEETINAKRCLTNYWKDSFMGLFNLLGNPVVLLQDDKIIAMNDAFKNDFFVSRNNQVRLTDLVTEGNKLKVKETLRKFVKGKHMKATTKTSLLMNGKLREARITFSKLDKALSGQMVMMINFSNNETPLKKEIGSSSLETENYFSGNDKNNIEDHGFTKREKEVITLLCKGYKTREISEALCISAKTIEKHRSNIIRRTNSGTIVESIVYALNHNMIEV
ncbi:response regulator transcription factor [Salinimicrobium flavum]